MDFVVLMRSLKWSLLWRWIDQPLKVKMKYFNDHGSSAREKGLSPRGLKEHGGGNTGINLVQK